VSVYFFGTNVYIARVLEKEREKILCAQVQHLRLTESLFNALHTLQIVVRYVLVCTVRYGKTRRSVMRNSQQDERGEGGGGGK
jgi:hypothetical protein